uniref:Capsid protein n=1 Tax=Syrmaticus reevesii Genomoviridae sp. TaxID=2814996 RepID=A0A8A4XD17_9VIRU|nr:MAG: capsid protein [Gemycircularvirus]UBQ66229.1 Cap protein [crane CRESS-DNA virus]
MLSTTNVTATAARPSAGALADGAATLNGAGAGRGSPYCFVWNATARDATALSGGNISPKYIESARTATTCYMVGLKERILVQSSTDIPWQWRRICVTAKGADAFLKTTPSTVSGNNVWQEDSKGYRRLLVELTAVAQGNLNSLLFDGQQDTDWNDPFSAKVDRQRFTIKYDRTVMLESNSSDGILRYYNMWHPMRKNVCYNDDEAGAGMSSAYVSASGKQGMGDYIVIDFIRCKDGAGTGDQLIFQPEATLYWHEK